jgi:hypothetical protein
MKLQRDKRKKKENFDEKRKFLYPKREKSFICECLIEEKHEKVRWKVFQ